MQGSTNIFHKNENPHTIGNILKETLSYHALKY